MMRVDEQLDAIERQRSRWITAINAGSPDRFVEIVTEDAVWLPSGDDAIEGRENIRRWLKGPFSELSFRYTVSRVRLRVGVERAVELARFSSRVTPANGKPLPVHEGDYVLIWRRERPGLWLIERYIDLSGQFHNVS